MLQGRGLPREVSAKLIQSSKHEIYVDSIVMVAWGSLGKLDDR